MKNNYKFLLLIPVIMLILLFGCRKPASTTTQQKAFFGVHLHTYIDTNLVSTGLSANTEYAQWFQDHNGRWMNITTANVYFTNVGLHSATTGQWYTLQGTIRMKRMEYEEYDLDSVPVDTYDNVRFTVGLGPGYNNNPPSYYSGAGIPATDSVLSTSESVMYANPGYYFLYLTGNVDTSAGHNLIHPIPFSYQLAGDTFQVSPPTAAQGNSFSIIPNVPGAQLVHIIFDYGKLLQSFPITSPVNIKSTTPTPVLDSIPGMFRYECSVPNGDC
jgi:hypothetical protein